MHSQWERPFPSHLMLINLKDDDEEEAEEEKGKDDESSCVEKDGFSEEEIDTRNLTRLLL